MAKHIHFVHFTTQPGGIEVKRPLMVENLVNYRFSAFVMRPPKPDGRNVYDGVPIKLSYGTNSAFAFWHLFKYARKNRNEVFHVFNIGPIALLMIRIAGVKKLVYAIHGTIYWRSKSQRLVRKIAWKLAMSSKYVITSNSLYSGSVFVNKVMKKASPLVLYNPIDSERFFKPTNHSINSKSLKIVYSGRLSSGKNLMKWIEIAYAINKIHPEYKFELFGEGPLKQDLQDYINKKNLQNVVLLKGFTDRPEEIYQGADLLLFLSEYESFGNVVIESILCGTPVIVGAIPSMKEIFRDYPEFLVPLDEYLLENVMQKIQQIGELRVATESAANEFKERYSLRQYISAVDNIYASYYA
jgi:glycosyltransferase involved in cell wall biosynthesis